MRHQQCSLSANCARTGSTPTNFPCIGTNASCANFLHAEKTSWRNIWDSSTELLLERLVQGDPWKELKWWRIASKMCFADVQLCTSKSWMSNCCKRTLITRSRRSLFGCGHRAEVDPKINYRIPCKRLSIHTCDFYRAGLSFSLEFCLHCSTAHRSGIFLKKLPKSIAESFTYHS